MFNVKEKKPQAPKEAPKAPVSDGEPQAPKGAPKVQNPGAEIYYNILKSLS